MGAWTFFPEAVEIRCSFEGGGVVVFISIFDRPGGFLHVKLIRQIFSEVKLIITAV